MKVTHLFFVLFLGSGFVSDVTCERNNPLSSLFNVAEVIADSIVGAILGVVDTARNVVGVAVSSADSTLTFLHTDLGGTLGDVINATTHLIPAIVKGGLSVYDDHGKRIPLTLDLPATLELQVPLEQSVSFTLYNSKNYQGEILRLNDADGLRKSNFQPQKETVLIVHGWLNSGKGRFSSLMRDAYLKMRRFNVIVVDWVPITDNLYIFSAYMVPKVGRHVAKMLDFLETAGSDPKKIRLVGYSLGAHVAGLAGYHARVKPIYVTGLDPGLPLFSKATADSRISTSSAENVEIIHTNGGFLGFMTPLGHADFYPNGGQTQFGCGLDVACSHSRSYELYAESLRNTSKFYASKCKELLPIMPRTCAGPLTVMGTIRNVLTQMDKGAFYLETNPVAPFARAIV